MNNIITGSGYITCKPILPSQENGLHTRHSLLESSWTCYELFLPIFGQLLIPVPKKGEKKKEGNLDKTNFI